METPICDFVRDYAANDALRLHMPGHKGVSFLGIEHRDITEIDGADCLYQAHGIILKSEQNAGSLFGCDTFYSTEGSSQSIRAMMYLTVLYAKQHNRKPVIAAVRNAHKAFLDAAALLDLDVEWLYPKQQLSYASCVISADELELSLQTMTDKPVALYVTSPDYLGHLTDIRAVSEVCHRHGVLLLVDNAHGAYLRFLKPSKHPIDLGVDLCCDSAHKTFPVLTGGAYLHISRETSSFFAKHAKDALALFGSTSPSYLVLQSLDMANAYLEDGYGERLELFISKVEQLKQRLQQYGYSLHGNEPLKIVLRTKMYGYTGTAFSHMLSREHIVCEFADPDFVVFMLTPEIGMAGLERLEQALRAVPRHTEIPADMPLYHKCDRILSIREAAFCGCETVPVKDGIGRVLASASVCCPPAVPIVVCGERIDASAVTCFSYYGITECAVVI